MIPVLSAFLCLVCFIAAAIAVIGSQMKLIHTLEADRDRARAEAKTYLGLLCPVTIKNEAVSGDASLSAQPSPSRSQASASPKAALTPIKLNGLRRIHRRESWLKFFNKVRAESNSKQQATDALASALAKQKTQEKTNVEASA